ncbi:exported hypothetical protein [Candidatus Zixiibacteriota bacterium]|nr:exported hypothetical protein [candidate division Zixibacteria bacterium]
MIKIIYILALSVVFTASAIAAEDLYLLQVENQTNLQAAKGILSHAYGIFDGKFIVSADSASLVLLRKAGLEPTLLARNIDIGKVFIAEKMRPAGIIKEITPTQSLSVSGEQILIIAEEAEAGRLSQSGYFLVPLAGKESPFFLSSQRGFRLPLEEFPTDTLADYVVQDSLYSYVHRLEEFKTRYVYTDSIRAARDWIYQKFLSFGYSDVRLDTFSISGGVYLNNVFCIKPGINEPDKVIVVGGHYDSVSDQAMTLAPGADDNASGTSGVLELARIMKDAAFDKTIIFVAFSAEESGLVGSNYFAQGLYENGVDVEFMLNLDMISYNADSVDDISLFSGTFRGYADLCAAAAERVAPNLVPIYAGMSQASDHSPFLNRGYDVAFVIERNYQTNPTYHNVTDISANMNYPFMTEIVRMAAATIGQVESMPAPVAIEDIRDIGDGQSLRIYWNDQCRPDYTYRIYYGTESAVYTDSVEIPAGVCQYDLTGLTEGQEYFIGVRPFNAEGHPSILLKESSGTSYLRPRIPADFSANPDTGKIVLNWRPNRELDINHYRVMRRDSLDNWSTLADNITDTSYSDESIPGQKTFQYFLRAYDNDMNESDSTPVMSAVRATFNKGIIFVDETASGGINPSEAQQTIFYDSIFGGNHLSKYYINTASQKISRSLAGQYSSMFWFDDDYSGHLFNNSLDSIKWYLGYEANFLLAGWQTVSWLTGSNPLGPGNFVYDYLGITQVTENSAFDFVGAEGVNGWPNLEVAPSGPFGAALSNIDIFALRPGAEVIYRFHSQSGNAQFEGEPAGVLYQDGVSKRIALSFPIYYLTESSAQALLAKVMATFGEGTGAEVYGDANLDGQINLRDITLLLRYLYKGGAAPLDMTFADADGNCLVNLADVIYLINFCYRHGAAPMKGCLLIK